MDLVYPNEKKLKNIAAVIAGLVWLLIIGGTFGVALVYIGIFFLFGLFAQAGFITYVKGSGVLITSEQFPDLYEQLQFCCKQVGVEEVPDTYLLRTDFFNALATRFLRRHYIVLFSDVVDALHDKPDAVNFYIGHELGHIHRNHIAWGWFLAPALLLPLLGNAFRRAEEYTCDRYGNICCESEDSATSAMAAIVAGDTRWKMLNVPAYLKQVEGTGGFWMSLNEITGEYPWLSKRMAWIVALRNNKAPEFPRRHWFAWFLSIFVPSVPGGIASAMVIVAVFGIIAAVALPAYQDYVKTAEMVAEQALDQVDSAADGYTEYMTQLNLVAVQNELGELRVQIDGYYAQNGQFPASFQDLGWQFEVLYSENGGMPTALYQDGIIGVSFGENEAGSIYFVNEPLVNDAGTLDWYCYGQNIDTALLPVQCQ